MSVLYGRRKKQRVRSGDPFDKLVLALQVISKLECVALPLEPDLFLSAGPCVEPLLQETFVGRHETVLVTHPVKNQRHLE